MGADVVRVVHEDQERDRGHRQRRRAEDHRDVGELQRIDAHDDQAGGQYERQRVRRAEARRLARLQVLSPVPAESLGDHVGQRQRDLERGPQARDPERGHEQPEPRPSEGVDQEQGHLVVALDLGINVLAAVTSNKKGFVPRLVSGKPLKSLNQHYNKQREHHQKRLSRGKRPRYTSRALDQLTTKRNRRIQHYLHTASRRIIDLCVKEGIGRIVVGKNVFWKQETNMGKQNNQAFVQLPHARFIDLLRYKGELVGIHVETHEESYTSKASFLDLDPIPTYAPQRQQSPLFSGKRIARSWYRAGNGQVIHADVNGSYNIGRKVAPTAFGLGVAGAAVRPRRLAV